MKCPSCGGAELVHETRDRPYAYKGQTTTVSALKGDYCPTCAEVVLGREEGDRVGALVGALVRQVNAGEAASCPCLPSATG